MRHGWLVALAALLVPASAAAQPAADAGPADSPAPAGAGEAGGEGGDALPPMLSDPRQLSGVPRGEGTDPPGRLTVRAVQGAMKRTEFGDVQSTFPAGAKIHLFAVGAGGKVTLQSVPLDKTGRAVFDRLARGSQSYVALALFPREGAEDRLVSRLISMPPQVGIRMILAGEAVDSKKPPVDDLATEEPKVVPPGPGEVLVHVRGDTKDVSEVDLFEAGSDKPLQRAKVEVTTGVDGKKGLVARYSGVAGGPDKVFYARAADQPRAFISLPFQLTSAQGAATNLILAPPVLFAFHGGATLDDSRLYFQLDISLYNASLVPFQPGPEGLRIPLPHGYTSASVGEDDMGEGGPPVKVDEDRGLLWRGPVPAGEHRFVASFALPAESGQTKFSMPLPYGLFQGQIVLEKVPGLKIEGPPGVAQRGGRADDGRPLIVLQNIRYNPGYSLNMTVSGLPQHPVWKTWLRNGIGVVVLGLLGWGAWGVARRGRRAGGRLSVLEAEREELLQSVVQLEAEFRRQRVAETVYQQRRAELMRQLEVVYADLAAEESARAAGVAAEEAARAETRSRA